MVQVDSPALRNLWPALNINGPAAAIEFDDTTLQQSLDVSRLLPGAGEQDGWFADIEVHTHVANGTIFSTFDPYTTVVDAQGLSREKFRCWYMRAALFDEFAPADGNISTMRAYYSLVPFPVGVTQGTVWLVAHSFFFDTIGATAASGFAPAILNEGTPIAAAVPQLLTPGSLALFNSTAANIAVAGPVEARFMHLWWIGPRGVSPPGVA